MFLVARSLFYSEALGLHKHCILLYSSRPLLSCHDSRVHSPKTTAAITTFILNNEAPSMYTSVNFFSRCIRLARKLFFIEARSCLGHLISTNFSVRSHIIMFIHLRRPIESIPTGFELRVLSMTKIDNISMYK